MAKNDNFYLRTKNQREYDLNKRLNISLRGQEKISLRGQEKIASLVDLEGKYVWDDATVIANAEAEAPLNLDATVLESQGKLDFIQEKYGIEFAQPVEKRTAPTSNPSRPRAKHLAYIKEKETLLVQFRDDAIVEYVGIPEVMWQDLKVTDSTGKYIDSSGIYEHPYRKVRKEQMPQELAVLFD